MFRIVLSSGLSWASYSVILNLLFLSFWGCVATEESPQETLRLRAKALRVTKKKGWQKGQHKRVIPSLLLRVRVTYKGVILSVFSVILRHKVPKNLILSPNSFLIRDSSGYLPPRNDKKEGDPSANTSGWHTKKRVTYKKGWQKRMTKKVSFWMSYCVILSVSEESPPFFFFLFKACN